VDVEVEVETPGVSPPSLDRSPPMARLLSRPLLCGNDEVLFDIWTILDRTAAILVSISAIATGASWGGSELEFLA
jgi:hypothetical protein